MYDLKRKKLTVAYAYGRTSYPIRFGKRFYPSNDLTKFIHILTPEAIL